MFTVFHQPQFGPTVGARHPKSIRMILSMTFNINRFVIRIVYFEKRDNFSWCISVTGRIPKGRHSFRWNKRIIFAWIIHFICRALNQQAIGMTILLGFFFFASSFLLLLWAAFSFVTARKSVDLKQQERHSIKLCLFSLVLPLRFCGHRWLSLGVWIESKIDGGEKLSIGEHLIHTWTLWDSFGSSRPLR